MKKLLNRKRKKSLVNFCYDVAKLLIAGPGLAGILQKDPPVGIIGMGLALAGVLFALAFYLEGVDDP